MIGNRQKEQLERMAAALIGGEPKECRVMVLPHRYFTREAGGGHGHPVVMQLVYLSNGDKERMEYMSTCREHYSAIDKAKEIARYLRDKLSVNPECIRVKDMS